MTAFFHHRLFSLFIFLGEQASNSEAREQQGHRQGDSPLGQPFGRSRAKQDTQGIEQAKRQAGADQDRPMPVTRRQSHADPLTFIAEFSHRHQTKAHGRSLGAPHPVQFRPGSVQPLRRLGNQTASHLPLVSGHEIVEDHHDDEATHHGESGIARLTT